MSARILSGREGVLESVEVLSKGGVVGVPTETVYGLAGNAFDPTAIVRIFESKARPLTDPLIVHLPKADWIERVVRFSSDRQRNMVNKLSKAFWPGPLTLLLPKHPDLPDLVTAGSEKVALRVTSQPLFQEVILGVGSPLAAPSANRFGKISPTSASDVLIELGEYIDLILDGGGCQHGLESTIVSVGEDALEILRPGPITEEYLKEFGHITPQRGGESAPGSLPGHYAPQKRLQIMQNGSDRSASLSCSKRVGLMLFNTYFKEIHGEYSEIEILSESGDLREAAANFYGALRRLDQSDVELILAQPVAEEGIGVAIMDRLRRASYGSIHGTGHHR